MGAVPDDPRDQADRSAAQPPAAPHDPAARSAAAPIDPPATSPPPGAPGDAADAQGRSPERARELIAQLVVTIRGFVQGAGATAAVLLLDQGSQIAPFVVNCPADGPVTLSEGEDAVQLDATRLAASPLPYPEIRPLPPFDVDAVRAEIASPLGGVEQYARAVRELSDRFPGRSVLTVTWPTTDPATPLHLAARPGDPMVLVLGEEPYEMAPDWPA